MPPKGGSPTKEGPVDASALFSELVKLQNTSDFEKAVKVCNKILNAFPSDEKAFHCKIVSLLQLAKFDVALQQIEENQERLNNDFPFEKSYALYRLNRVSEALQVLDKVNPKNVEPRMKELKAQVLYRLEKFDECYNIYREIIKNSDDDFDSERLTNLSAAAIYAGRDCVDGDEATYEMVYNKACHLLTEGKWMEAENSLKKAIQMCTDFLKEEEGEDISEEDIDKEIGIMRVQMGYAVQMQGREKEAQTIYNQVLKGKPTDAGLIAVASNNLLTLNKDQNIFDSKKRIKAATTGEGLEHKLTTQQRRQIARNNALLAMYTNQVDLCRKLMNEVADKFGMEKEDKILIEAGALSRAGKTKEAVDVLLKGGKKNLEKVLIAAQIYLEKGEVKEAVQVFQELKAEDKYRPGILSAMVTLYLALNDRENAAKLLKGAVDFNKESSRGKGSSKDMAIVWRKTAEFYLKGDEPSVAAQSLEELLKNNPKDRQTLAQLVLAYAKFDLKKALEASKKLPDFKQGSVDVESLETSAFLGTKYAKKTPKPGGGGSLAPSPKPGKDDNDTVVKKKKKTRKRKLRHIPKNYDPNVDPDPERWLPKRERTGYRKTRKERRKGEKFTGAQGTAQGQADNFDYSQKKASATGAVPKSSAKSPEAPVGPRQQHRKPQQKKKGGKKRF